MNKTIRFGMIAIIVVLLVLGGIIFLRPQVSASQYKKTIDLGQKYLSEGKYEEAVIAFDKAIKIDARQIDAYLGNMESYLQLEKPKLALATLKDSLQGEDRSSVEVQKIVEAGSTIAEDLLTTSDADLAVECYVILVKLDKKDVSLQVVLAKAYIAAGNDEKALAVYALLDKDEKLTSDSVVYYAELLTKMGQQDEAEWVLEKYEGVGAGSVGTTAPTTTAALTAAPAATETATTATTAAPATTQPTSNSAATPTETSKSLFGGATSGISDKIKAGDYLNFGTYYGEPILWKCVEKNDGDIILASEYILCQKAFDAAESGTFEAGSDEVQRYGSNLWSNSNIREWLNSASKTVNYTTQAPTNSAVWKGYNAYADEPGFLSNFTQAERDAIKSVTHDGVTDKVYLPSVDEVNLYYGNTDSQRVRKMTEIGKQKGEYKYESNGNIWWQWTRSPLPGYSSGVRYVGLDGTFSGDYACGSGIGVAPALHLSSYISIKGSGTISDPWSY